MEVSFLSILVLGFVLGIKHAIEPDHVIAVSTIASRSKKLLRSSLAGMFWGIGHTATLFIFGIVLILMKSEISEKWAMSLEFLVGIMLVYLGLTSILSIKKLRHSYNQKDDEQALKQRKEMFYMKSMFIGLVHGLAGSAALVLLTMTTVQTVLQGVFYILVFGLGTIVGMLFFTTIIGIPFVLSASKISVNKTFTQVTSVISILFGVYYMYNLGIVEGLFNLWVQ